MFNRFIHCTVSMAVILTVLISSPFSEAASHLDNKWLCDPAPNPDMTYMLRSNSQFVTLGVPFQTNELGFRDRPVFEKTAGVFRIL
ncbi:MAG: hypothetical protein KC978_22610, partial [Candidatus Omnitrophica bacterium]|nr:hypothetical protein [Candidatus Omnitrophota bacterium]